MIDIPYSPNILTFSVDDIKIGTCPSRKPANCLREEKPECDSDWQCPGNKRCCKFIVILNALTLFPSADQVSQQRNLEERNEPQDLALKGMGLSEGVLLGILVSKSC